MVLVYRLYCRILVLMLMTIHMYLMGDLTLQLIESVLMLIVLLMKHLNLILYMKLFLWMKMQMLMLLRLTLTIRLRMLMMFSIKRRIIDIYIFISFNSNIFFLSCDISSSIEWHAWSSILTRICHSINGGSLEIIITFPFKNKVFRIHLKLIRIQIMNSSLKFIDFVFNKAEFSNYFNFLLLIFMLKLDEPFRDQEIFIISLFLTSSDLGFESKFCFCSFWLIFRTLDPDLVIRIFLRIRI